MDLTYTREFTLDLSKAGQCYSRKNRPANRRRQEVVRFIGLKGEIETFTVEQTLPVVGDLYPQPPSDQQAEAVEYFFEYCPRTRRQAHTMLCARDYGMEVSKVYSFASLRRELIGVSVAAYLLGSQKFREEVRQWCEEGFRGLSRSISSGIGNHRPYQAATQFADKLVKDMRGSGSRIFG